MDSRRRAGKTKIARTKEKLFAATCELLREKSSDDFSRIDVANRAGITVSTTYRHFDSKQELIMESIDDLLGTIDADACNYSQCHSPIQALSYLLDRLLDDGRAVIISAHLGYRSGDMSLYQNCLVVVLESYLEYFDERGEMNIPINLKQVAEYHMNAIIGVVSSAPLKKGFAAFAVGEILSSMGMDTCMGSLVAT